MNEYFKLADDRVIPFLLDSTLQSTLLLTAASVIALSARRSSAATQHLIYSAALAGALLIPILTFCLPAWRVRWIPTWSATSAIVPPESMGPSFSVSSITPPVDTVPTPSQPAMSSAVQSIAAVPVGDPPSDAFQERAPVDSPLPSPVVDQGAGGTWNRLQWLPSLWLCGVFISLVPMTVGLLLLRRLTRRCAPVIDPAWLALQGAAGKQLHLRRRVTLHVGDAVRSPLTWGALHPVLLLPTEAHGWSADRRRLVLLHELAHVKRFDWLTQTVAYVACAIYWFNPLAWWAARRMRIERERACDDAVLAAGSRPVDYANELLKLASSITRRSLIDWTAVPIARRSTLEGRLLAIVDSTRNRAALSRTVVLTTAFVLAVVAVPVAMMRAAPQLPAAEQIAAEATRTPTAAAADSNEAQQSTKPAVELLAIVRRSGNEAQAWRPDGEALSPAVRQALGWHIAPTISNRQRLGEFQCVYLVRNLSLEDIIFSRQSTARGEEPRELQIWDIESNLGGMLISGRLRSELPAVRYGFPNKPWRELLVWNGADGTLKEQREWPTGRRAVSTIRIEKGIEVPISVDALTGLRPRDPPAVVGKIGTRLTLGSVVEAGVTRAWSLTTVITDVEGKKHRPLQLPATQGFLLQVWDFDLPIEKVRDVTLLGRSFADDYEWTEFPQPAMQPAQGLAARTAAGKPVFGPVIERVLKPGGESSSLNLDDGKYVKGEFGVNVYTTLRAFGIDVWVSAYQSGLDSVNAYGLRTQKLDTDELTSLSPDGLIALHAAAQSELQRRGGPLQAPISRIPAGTYAFSTDERLGVMQVIAKTGPDGESPDGVLVRYRTLQNSAVEPATAGPTTPTRKFVRIVVDLGALTFEGESTTWEKLPELLAAIPDRGNTVLELAVASNEYNMRQLAELQSRAANLARDHRFEYSSFVGVQSLGSKGTSSDR